MISRFQLSIFAFLIGSITVRSLDVSMKGDGCSTFDRCTVRDIFRTCNCDIDCHLYGTCCIDAENFPLMETVPREFSCHFLRTTTPVFVKTSCSNEFKGHDDSIASCQDQDRDLGDMLDNLLITSAKTKITYSNIHCAICNNEGKEDIQYWTVEVSCPSKHGETTFDQRFIRKNLIYHESSAEWGLKIESEFLPCSVLFYQPNYLFGKLKYCAPDVISTCPENYTDSDVVSKCSYYHGERKQKSSSQYFKNVHCAVCNGVELKDLDCVGRNYGPAEFNTGADVVKAVFSNGEWISKEGKEKFQCSQNFTYDPFQKRCRRYFSKTEEAPVTDSASILCIQFYVLFAATFVFINKFHCVWCLLC